MEDKKCNCCWVCKVVCLLVVIGAINWGLVGVSGLMDKDWNVVHMLLGQWMTVEYVVYILVGVAGVMKIFASKCPCRKGSCERN